MRKAHLLVLAASLIATACEQLTATVQGVSALTRTPDIAQAEGMPSELATALSAELAAIQENGAVLTAVGLGERDSPTSTQAPTPIDNAMITLTWTGGGNISLCAGDEPGTYAATSVQAGTCGKPSLAYVAGTKYVTEIETADELYTITVVAPPAIQANQVTFTPQLSAASGIYGVSLKSHSAGAALTVDWSAAGDDRPAFLTLFRIQYKGPSNDPNGATNGANWDAGNGQPVYDNFPKTPGEMIDLVLADEKPTSLVIPGDRFVANSLYALIVTPTEISTDVSNNLSLGSGGMAGYGTAFVFWAD